VPSKGDRTREAVRVAADTCFRERGFDGATSAEIARRAGVAEGTVFLHFGNKLGLLGAVTEAFYDRLQAAAELADAGPGDRIGRLRKLVDTWALCLEHDWHLISVFIQKAQSSEAAELSVTVRERNRRYTRLFTDLFTELQQHGELPDAPPALLRDMLFGAFEHTARGQSAAGRPIRVRETGRTLVDLLLHSTVPFAPVGPFVPGEPPRPSGPAEDQMRAIETKLDRILDRLPGA
jgi:AcrR family transcriptional regulator